MIFAGATLSDRDHADVALRLRGAAQSLCPIPPILESHPGAGIQDAYAIQEINTAWGLAHGRRMIGAKTGMTAKAIQARFGVEEPDFGSLFADMEISDGDAVEPGRLLLPQIEAEIAFVLGRTPDPEALSTAALINCVDYALPAIEIIDTRIAEWRIGIIDTIADNASSGLFVLGTRPVALERIDLRMCGMRVERNGEPVVFGAGAACLGNPLHALRWLTLKRAQTGRPLGAGDIVLTGALGPLLPVNPGDHVETAIEGLGSVRVRFAR